MKQKEIFLQSEGDAWFERNHEGIKSKNFSETDAITNEIQLILKSDGKNSDNTLKILEVGCGEGARLAWLKENLKLDVYGIEPSLKAVDFARKKHIDVVQGTADNLPFQQAEFDVVVFGFCLYLCDEDDLFKIANEAHRVLNGRGWIIIEDFYSQSSIRNNYHHKAGVQAHKMDYRKLFDWHPNYTCYSHTIRQHKNDLYIDDAQEWVATSVIRKMM